MAARIREAQDLLRSVQRKGDELKFMCNDAVPIDLEGSMLLPVIPERDLVTEFLGKKKVTNAKLETHLFNLLQDFIEALQAKDQTKLAKMGEANFVAKLLEKREGGEGGAPQSWFNF